MKGKYKNLEKPIFFILLIILLVSMPVLLKSRVKNNTLFKEKIQMLIKQSCENKLGCEYYVQGEQDLMLDKKTARSLASIMSKRNIFVPEDKTEKKANVVSDRPILEVIEIGFKPLEIEFRGKLSFKEENGIVAQINVHNKSYLVKEGASFEDYQVEELNNEFIKFIDEKGKVTKLKYRQKTYTKERIANIKELTSVYSKQVSKNDSFLEYKVLDIDEDSVLLSLQGQHIRLEKGMVHK